MIAHNGEINTLRGNANRLQGREEAMAARRLTDDMSELFPILQPGGSDSACFDNVWSCWSGPAARRRTP